MQATLQKEAPAATADVAQAVQYVVPDVNIYETKDGFMTAAVMTNKEWAALTRALERPDWLQDPRFATPALRDSNIDVRLGLVEVARLDMATRQTGDGDQQKKDAQDLEQQAPGLLDPAAVT